MLPGPDHEQGFLNALKGVGEKPVVLPQEASNITEILESVSKSQPAGTTTVAAPPSTVTTGNLWRHPDAHPIVLDLFMLRRYGPDWLGWEAETLRARIPEDFKTQTVSELNISKLQACRALHLVDSFWQRWEVFIACLMPLNGEFPNFRVMPVPTVAQCLVAVDAANRIREDVAWSDEMKAYLAAVYQHDDIFLPLPPTDFVQLEVPDSIDAKKLAEQWAVVRASNKAPSGDTVMDEQLRRLLGANTFLEESRTRLRQQMELHA